MAKVTKVAILGGSFNPPTMSHAMVGLELIRVGAADEIWYLPSNHHPFEGTQRHKRVRAPYEDRCEMVRAMLYDMKRMHRSTRHPFMLCLEEERFDGPCYAKDVLESLMSRNAGIDFRWVIGSDCLLDLPRWRYYDWLRDNVSFIVYPRPGYSDRDMQLRDIVLEGLDLEILTPGQVIVSNVSSTFVRNNPDAKWAMTRSVADLWDDIRGSGSRT